MSTTFSTVRVCEYCKKEFTAYTTKTRYCSRECNRHDYKSKKRNDKIKSSEKETVIRKLSQKGGNRISNNELVRDMEFLTVRQTAILLNCSRQNIYKLINSGRLASTNILQNKTLIKRTDIDKLFKQSKPIYEIRKPKVKLVELADCYTTNEVQEKFNISRRTLHSLIKNHNIPKLQHGWYHYVPKELINDLIKQ